MDQPQLQGGTSFSLESLMKPNFVFFIVTLAIVGYLYQTRTMLGRESEIKSQSSNLFEKQMYFELGFMILIGVCIYIFNCNDNNTFTWIYILVPIVYLMIKSLLIFNKVTDYIDKAPEHKDISTDIVDLINANKNNTGQVPVTNQNSNTTQVTHALNQALGMNNNKSSLGTMMPPIMQQPTQPAQPMHPPMSHQPEGFALF